MALKFVNGLFDSIIIVNCRLKAKKTLSNFQLSK